MSDFSVEDVKAGVEAASEIAQAATPMVQMAINTFMSTVQQNPQMVEAVLPMVPEPMQSQIRAAMAGGRKQSGEQSIQKQTTGSSPWLWVGLGVAGVAGVAGIAYAVSKKKR